MRRFLYALAAVFLFLPGPPIFAQSSYGPFTLSANNQCTGRIDATGITSLGMQITGTSVLTLTPEVSIGGQPPTASQFTQSTSTSGPVLTYTTSGSTNVVFSASVAGAKTFVLCVTAYTSGSAIVNFQGSNLSAKGIGGAGGGGGGSYTFFGNTQNPLTALADPTIITDGAGNVLIFSSSAVSLSSSSFAALALAVAGSATLTDSSGDNVALGVSGVPWEINDSAGDANCIGGSGQVTCTAGAQAQLAVGANSVTVGTTLVEELAGSNGIKTTTTVGPTLLDPPSLSDVSSLIADTHFVKNQGYIANPSPGLTGTPTAPTAAGGTNTTQIANTAFVAANFAPLASPALTGNPTAPTQTALNNSTRLATTAYADAAVAVETSRATTAEALLAPKASPALTGTPTAPTAAPLTGGTQIATNAYADAAVAAGKPLGTPVNVVNSSSSISATTLFTPTVSGLYKINGYVAQSAGCSLVGTGSITLNYLWTDETGANSASVVVMNFVTSIAGGNTNVEQGLIATFDVWAIAGQPIQYSTTYNGCTSGTATYNLHGNVTPN